MKRINKTTILTLLSCSVLGVSLVTVNFNNIAYAAKTEKVIHQKLTKHQKELKARKAAKKKKSKNKNDNNGPTNITTVGPNFNKNNSKKPNKIANGYNYTKDEVTDFNQYCQVFQQTALNTINKFRQEHGEPPLTEDSTLDKIAMQRAQQNYELRHSSWFDGHHDQDGIAFVDKVAVQDGLYVSVNESDTHLSENSTTGSLNESAILQDPISAAKGSVNDNIIEGTGGGHYQNMMDPTNIKMGIGIYIGPNHGQQTAGGEDEVYSNQ